MMVLRYEPSFSQKSKGWINPPLTESNQKIISLLLPHLKPHFLWKWSETEAHIYFEKIRLEYFIALEINFEYLPRLIK